MLDKCKGQKLAFLYAHHLCDLMMLYGMKIIESGKRAYINPIKIGIKLLML
jgi:hypothetical protein